MMLLRTRHALLHRQSPRHSFRLSPALRLHGRQHPVESAKSRQISLAVPPCRRVFAPSPPHSSKKARWYEFSSPEPLTIAAPINGPSLWHVFTASISLILIAFV